VLISVILSAGWNRQAIIKMNNGSAESFIAWKKIFLVQKNLEHKDEKLQLV
jgi:hypothetical protein